MVDRSILNQAQTRADIADSRASSARSAAVEAEIRAKRADENAARERESARDAASYSMRVLAVLNEHKKLNIEITARSRELLFQMAIQDFKFRATIDRIKKVFPDKQVEIDEIVSVVDEKMNSEDDQAKKWKEQKREISDQNFDLIESMEDLHMLLGIGKKVDK